MWQLASELWHGLSESEILEWERAGTRRGMTGFAWYMSQALRPNPGIYLPLAGGIMAGDIVMNTYQIHDLPAPATAGDAARKAYVDAMIAAAGLGKGCRAIRSTDQVIPHNVPTAVIFDGVSYDQDDIWAAAPNPERLTVQTTGVYLIVAVILWLAHASGSRYEMLQHSVDGQIALEHTSLAPGNVWRGTVSSTYYAEAGEYFYINVQQTSGVDLGLQASPNTGPSLAIHRIG